ncbi:MAG: hypothetical protein QNJ46_09310 [Leptolyngbyaceae cyanobacterium MO_188.B28]|nr:hypothetical protein [Leptolyngbyaceae cyanobacterium MO_188.B28]
MNFFAFLTERLGESPSAIQNYWRISREWFLKTPERSLSRAYNAAVMIKMVEEKFSENGEFCTRSVCINDDQKAALKTGFKKKMLSILKLRLAEFKFSCSVLGILNSNGTEKFKFIGGNVGKLRFIDQVLEKYISEENSFFSVPYQEDTTTNNSWAENGNWAENSAQSYQEEEVTTHQWPENRNRPVTIDVQVTEYISE